MNLAFVLIPIPPRVHTLETVPITDYYDAIVISLVIGVLLTLILILPFFFWQYYDFCKLKKNLKSTLRVERLIGRDGPNTILIQNNGLLPFKLFDAYIEIPFDSKTRQTLYSTDIVRQDTVFPWRRLENRFAQNAADFCICPETVIYRREIAKLMFRDDLTNSNLILCLHTSSGFTELNFEELKTGKTIVLPQEYSYQKRKPKGDL